MGGKKVVFCPYGSLGDVHPIVALAREMKQRGHSPVVATSPAYRAVVEKAGVAFHPVRPEVDVSGPETLASRWIQTRACDTSCTK
jgi:rhamnosyltransferase subunit B